MVIAHHGIVVTNVHMAQAQWLLNRYVGQVLHTFQVCGVTQSGELEKVGFLRPDRRSKIGQGAVASVGKKCWELSWIL